MKKKYRIPDGYVTLPNWTRQEIEYYGGGYAADKTVIRDKKRVRLWTVDRYNNANSQRRMLLPYKVEEARYVCKSTLISMGFPRRLLEGNEIVFGSDKHICNPHYSCAPGMYLYWLPRVKKYSMKNNIILTINE